MLTLGINAAFHDSAAVLVRDGVVLAASEEERFTRIRHAKRPMPLTAWELPFHAIDDCLRQGGARLVDVDHVAYSYDPQHLLQGRAPVDRIRLPLRATVRSAAERERPWDALFAAYVADAPAQLADGAPHHLCARFAGARADGPYRFHFVGHQLCHQASAFLACPFDSCAVLTLGGRGEQGTTSYGVYENQRYAALGEVCAPHSLGLLYEQVTQHLGFLHASDESRVMALAALGSPRYLQVLRQHVQLLPGGDYRIDAIDLAALAGPARVCGAPLERWHFDLAASLQAVLEDSALRLVRWLRQASGQPRLAMAGGVALNCVMNARLRDSQLFERIWVQPAAGDAGTALGAALWIDACHRDGAPAGEPGLRGRAGVLLAPRRWTMEHAYLGPEYGDTAIETLLAWARLPYRRVDDVCETAAGLLARGSVIGWFQGRMEFGPRALGARSILASPADPAMQGRINDLKDGEDFRPVAPAVPQECLADWFSPASANGGQAPFMLFVYNVHPEKAASIPAACHHDLTARVQTVTAASNPRLHAVLHAFGRLTGVPVLINTSFKVGGQPIVCTPKDAVDAFHSTPLDALVIGSFLLEKAR